MKMRQFLRRLFYLFRDPFGRGVFLSVGGRAIRVPIRFARAPWANYEVVSTTAVAGWLQDRPNAALLDIGSSVGLYSLLALHAGARTEAYAFDASLIALKATRWICRFSDGIGRLHLVFGFVADRQSTGETVDKAARETELMLDSPSVPREPSRTGYVCIDGQPHPEIPVRSIDGLFPTADAARPWLLKCDVEGAEMLVLKGAAEFIRRTRAQLLLSIHPATLEGFGFTVADVRLWLEARGYRCRILAVDHEEHWWCTPEGG